MARVLAWDGERAVGRWRGRRSELTGDCQAFRGTAKVIICRPRDPEAKGLVERFHDYLERAFLPGRVFTSPTEFNAQLARWIGTVNSRYRRHLECAPSERIATHRAAMIPLPPVAPAAGWRRAARLPRDHYIRYIRLDSNYYSVDPSVIGRRIEVRADLARVRASCGGRLAADHERASARHQTLTGPARLVAARALRQARRALAAVGRPAAAEVEQRDLAVYDRAFGTAGGQGGGMTMSAVLVPARNEGPEIDATLKSLAGQTAGPARIVVIVNNSTDDTAARAARFAARRDVPPTDVLVMPGRNRFKKAGALNYGLRHLMAGGQLPAGLGYLGVIDADTVLAPHFLERATRVMDRDLRLGGISAACLGKPLRGATPWQRLLLFYQKIEYGRFAATRLRRNVHTMSGAGSLYRASALAGLLASRPDVFEERPDNLVEDYETTLALKLHGWRITSNQQCVAYTDLMPTLRMLTTQRTRWVRGTIGEWRRYGWCRATWLSMTSMIVGFAGVIYAIAWTATSIVALTVHGGAADPRYLLLAAFWSAYQGITARSLGWRVVLFEVALIPEALFNVIRNYWLIRSILTAYFSRTSDWA